MSKKELLIGTSIIDVTPQKPMFLHGYPKVNRISQGVYDPLYASAMIIDNGKTQIGFCAVDVVFISKEITKEVRKKVREKTGIPEKNLMISASHTHSGPVTFSDIFYDPVVPKADPEYINYLIEKLVVLFTNAFNTKKRSKIAITTSDGTGVGGNRRNLNEAYDKEVSVIVVKDSKTSKITTISTIYSMHPTVLHEDSKFYSADFPGFTRKYINSKLGKSAILLYQTGPSGNQSPRHFVKSNTFSEAKRLGYLLGKKILESIKKLQDNDYHDYVSMKIISQKMMLPKKKFMSLEKAEEKRMKANDKLESLKKKNAANAEIRTAEVDWFGAEENKQLVEMSLNGKLDEIYKSILPVEISIISINDYKFVFLPGEIFVEYSLMIKEKSPRTYIVSLANGVLAGYIVTENAEMEGGYEALNSIFPVKAGTKLVKKVISLIPETRNQMEKKNE